MGHFGRNPIRMAWLGFVCPSLVLNYVGQGAFALAEPAAIQDLFFLSAPEWARLPMVVLATLATIIAGQAVITGAYSLTRQAMQLGLLPYLEVQQTSESEHGQIYLPKINWLMLAGVVALVLLFGSSSRLASAYGVAVTGTMIVTSLLAVVVLARSWRWGVPLALLVVAPFLLIDGAFLVANLLKLPDGGYVPLLFGAVIMLLMWTWIRGTRIVSEKVRRDSVPLTAFIRSIESSDVVRVPGTAMFLTSNPHNAPAALLHNLKHNKVVHESNVLVTVRTASQPYVADAERITLTKVATGFSTLEISYGFMEDPTLLRALKKARGEGLKFDIMGTSFFLGRRQIRQAAKGGMPSWQDALFIRMMRQSHDTTEYYRIPPDRVVELGTHVTI
jgi:KUP system potassium uptake protein